MGADRFTAIENLAVTALKKIRIPRSPKGPLTRARSLAKQLLPVSDSERLSGQAIPTPIQSDVDTDGLLTADEDLPSCPESVSGYNETTDDESQQQVVQNFLREQAAHQGNLTQDADNEDSDQEQDG